MKFIPLLILACLFTSCKTASLAKNLKSGSYFSTEEVTEVVFYNQHNTLIIPVKIGENTYQFLFDTGAPNVISPEVAAAIQTQNSITQKVYDSSGKAEDLAFIEIPLIEIGGAEFRNTGAAIADFNKGNVLSCFNIDGIIGANLMRLCHVQIDYPSETIRFAKNYSALIMEDGFSVPFTHELQASPYINLKVGHKSIKKVLVDTGFTGFINLDKSLKATTPIEEGVAKYRTIGTTTEGIFGLAAPDTSINYLMGDFSLDTVQIALLGTVIFQGTNKKLIGNEFLNNFVTTYNWSNKTIHFSPVMKAAVVPQAYEIGFMKIDDKLVVAWVKEGTTFQSHVVKPGTQVLIVDELDTRECSHENYCDVLEILKEKRPQIHVLVLLDGRELEIILERKDLF